ncbi:hypothetical protein [Stutzerimonas stutzeri]|nr:hypothetical protein [Stutzerimonas stutzeri]
MQTRPDRLDQCWASADRHRRLQLKLTFKRVCAVDADDVLS